MMSTPYTEEQVLRTLDIPDFRHLTKEKVIEFASMIPQMDPEVAKAALEQFPNFASTALEVMNGYKGTVEQWLKEDSESARESYRAYDRVTKALESMLNQESMTFEGKKIFLIAWSALPTK